VIRMNELWVSVDHIKGICTGPVEMSPGTGFLVRKGRLHFPHGGPICIFALQNLLPFLCIKEREDRAKDPADWVDRLHEVQCPDPKGLVDWRIESRPLGSTAMDAEPYPVSPPTSPREGQASGTPNMLYLTVQDVEGVCPAGMRPGVRAILYGSSLYLPQAFCLYAMAALIPLLPAMQRQIESDDWMASENVVACPDPAGGVMIRIDRVKA